jgi:L-cysteate sulfo-lyase
MTSIACLPSKNGRAIILHILKFETAGSGSKSGNKAKTNERPKLGSGEGGVQVCLWVDAGAGVEAPSSYGSECETTGMTAHELLRVTRSPKAATRDSDAEPERSMPIQSERQPRFTLLEGCTPIQRLIRLEKALGCGGCPPIYVKRDDLMGIGGGGNKLRKLEFLIGEALDQSCDTFITTGARQSNHARLSAAAAGRAGLSCELVLTDTVAHDDEAYRRNGNVLLDDLFGATVHRRPGNVDALTIAQERAMHLSAKGRRAYVVGSGGSSPVGCLGYAVCAKEILAQEQDLGLRFSRIIVPNGSSGTHAGLAAGLKASGDEPGRVESFTVLAPIDKARAVTAELAARTLALIDPTNAFVEGDIVVTDGQLGDGYGVPTDAMFEAVRLVARSEGLLLDPVYGGKAFAGLIASIRESRRDNEEPMLFVMTGGLPGLFAYEPAFRWDQSR